MELLRSAPNTPPLLLEIEADEKVNPVEKMSEAFRKAGNGLESLTAEHAEIAEEYERIGI